MLDYIFTSTPGVSPSTRCIGKMIDLLIIMAIFYLGNAFFFQLGTVGAIIFCGIQDCLTVSGSFGKSLVGLRVFDIGTKVSCSWKSSWIRNLPFSIAILFFEMPGFWIINLLIIFPIIVLEIYFLFSFPSGVRLGDVLAKTRVVELGGVNLVNEDNNEREPKEFF